jgi:hypothetical protein
VSLAARLRRVAGEAARTEARWLIEAAGDDAARLEETASSGRAASGRSSWR